MPATDLHLLSEHHFVFSGLIARYQIHFLLGGLCLALGSCLLALDVTDTEALTFWAVSVIVIGLPCFFPSLLTYLRSLKKVRVYEEGIAWFKRGREEFHAWDEVREVYRAEKSSSAGSRQAELILVVKKQEPVVFDQRLSDFFHLATLVEALVTEHLLPRYRHALEQGEASFGPVVLKRQGIRIHDREFRWEEVEECAICNGGLAVTPFTYEDFTGEFAGFDTIPNYLILLQLLEELGKRPVAAEQCIVLTGRKPKGSE